MGIVRTYCLKKIDEGCIKKMCQYYPCHVERMYNDVGVCMYLAWEHMVGKL